MTQILILAEGNLRYRVDQFGDEQRSARVFIVDYQPSGPTGNVDHATVIFREAVMLESGPIPAGSIRQVAAAITDNEYPETFLTYDLDQVPA